MQNEKWKAALKRAALPGTVKVKFTFSKPAPNEMSYRLSCYDDKGSAIGDDRDYDILKAVITPLENLCDDDPVTATYDLNSDDLDIQTG